MESIDKELVEELTVIVPWNIYTERKTMPPKKHPVNLNYYRNLKGVVNNTIKKKLKEDLKEHLEPYKLVEPVEVHVTVHKPTKRKSDKSNQYTVASKYLYDAMVQLGVLTEDNDDIIWDEHLNRTQLDPEKKGYIKFEFKSVKPDE